MRPPMWIDIEAARRQSADWHERWAKLSEEERAKECGMTLEAFRRMCKGAYALGQGMARGLNEATVRVLKAKVKP